jgi:hypothetical protein
MSSTERSRRSRKHARNDHSECDPAKCLSLRAHRGAAAEPLAAPDDVPPCPLPLAEDGDRLWRSVLAEYELGPHERELLAQAAQLADYIAVADARLAREGLVVDGRYHQPVPHPMLKMQVEQRRQLAQLIAHLALPDPQSGAVALPASVARLPRATGNRWSSAEEADGGT